MVERVVPVTRREAGFLAQFGQGVAQLAVLGQAQKVVGGKIEKFLSVKDHVGPMTRGHGQQFSPQTGLAACFDVGTQAF